MNHGTGIPGAECVSSRRQFVRNACVAMGAGAFAIAAPMAAAAEQEKKVTATEDLMREHGVLRRALLVYRESVPRLHDADAELADALQKTARLFRDFGEDYHERMLEEQYIFPAVRKAGGPAAGYVDTLLAQHRRGRELTDYILAATRSGRIGAAHAAPLGKVLDGFVVMYQNHTAREDTVVFPGWKQSLPEKRLEALADKFEEIEHRQFGKDGFEDAVATITRIEQQLGLADLAQFTPPAPPQTG